MDKDFNRIEFAEYYIRNHKNMNVRLGYAYSKKISEAGFTKGKILNAGCGFGGMDIIIANHFKECTIVGIDMSKPLLEYAHKSVHQNELTERIQFKLADVQQIPFNDNEFDIVFCLNVAHLVDNPNRMFNEIERVLAPDGLLFIADIKRSWLSLFEKELKNGLTLAEVKRLIHESDLRPGIFSHNLIWWKYEVMQRC